MAQSTIWDKTKTGGKAGWNKLYSIVDKLGPPVNKLSNKLGSEAFWPTSMDKECDKAARILRSFCKDGFYTEEERPNPDGPKQKQKVIKKIPTQVIKDAKALAIFTTMRTGLWLSGSGGSGVLIAKKDDGSWSPPSGIQVQTMGLGFLVGVDIYDCVLVINTQRALEAFTRFRATIGGDLSVTAGPVGAGAQIDTEIHARQAPIFTYMKSRGFYAGVAIDGTVIIERVDENERFYHERVPALDILKGKVRHTPFEARGLLETLKAAEGDESCDPSFIPDDLPPSDYEIQQDGHVFSVPDKDDPDPYGVLQLEKEGLVIREAGTQKRASWDQFTFAPSAKSPLFESFDKRNWNNRVSSRGSIASRRSSGMPSPSINGPAISPIAVGGYARSSYDSPRTPVSMSDAGTQTDDLPPMSPGQSSVRWGSAVGTSRRSSMEHIPEDETAIPTVKRHSRVRSVSGTKQVSASSTSRSPTPPAADGEAHKEDAHQADTEHHDEHDDDEEEAVVVEAPVVRSIQRTITPQVITTRARMVDVPKRGPPPTLPPRNPNRSNGIAGADGERSTSEASIRSSDDSYPRTSTDQAAEASSPPAALETIDLTPPEPPKIILEDHTVDEHPTEHDTLPESHVVEEAAEEAHAETAAHENVPDETPEEGIKDPWNKVLARHESIDGSAEDSDKVASTYHSPELPGSFD